jgi:type IV secretory pathway protease TraF
MTTGFQSRLDEKRGSRHGPQDRFIKRVVATHGQVVCASGADISIDGAIVAYRQNRDSAGRTLPSWTGCKALSEGQVLLLGDTPDSFDGRYWGPISRDKIEGVWRPL